MPYVIKISPDNSNKELDSIVKLLFKYKVDGVIATNTTIDKKQFYHLNFQNKMEGYQGRHLIKNLQGQFYILIKF